MIGQTRRHPEWRLLVEALSAREYGAFVPHEEIASVLQLAYPSPRYFGQVSRARRTLRREWRRELLAEPGEGYRLIEPVEFHGQSRRQVSFAGRRLRVGMEILIAAPQEKLTDADNARNADALAKLGALETQRRRVIRQTRPSLPPPKTDVPKMLKKA
jgi:hypothetical protein